MAIAATISLVYTVMYSTFAYLLPGYQTFKAVEKRGSEEVREWAQYWVVLASFYCLQFFVDLALSWMPFYYVAKLAFLVALWHPSTRLALSIYANMFSPLVSRYEADIDKLYMDTRTKMNDFVGRYASTASAQARKAAAQANTMLKNVQQKAMDRAKAAHAPAGPVADTTAGHGLHTE